MPPLTLLEPGYSPRPPEDACAMGIMAKVPRSGRVKTRLVPPLTHDQASALSECFLRDVAASIATAAEADHARIQGVAVYLAEGEEQDFRDGLPRDFLLLAQRGAHLGERLFHAAVGGLLLLSSVILPHLVKQGDRAAWSMAGIATRFSRIAGVGVGLIVLTASYQEWAIGGSVDGLVRSPYGRTIIAKIVLFSMLLLLGAFNRYISVPRLQEWACSAKTRQGALGRLVAPARLPLALDARWPPAAARFTRTVKLEAFLLVALLLCAALLRHEVPARDAAHLEHHALGRSAGVAAVHGDDPSWRSPTTPPLPALGKTR